MTIGRAMLEFFHAYKQADRLSEYNRRLAGCSWITLKPVNPRTDNWEFIVPQNHIAACSYCILNNMKACSYFEFECGNMKFTEVAFDIHNINVITKGGAYKTA
jgi:hypothetical protein